MDTTGRDSESATVEMVTLNRIETDQTESQPSARRGLDMNQEFNPPTVVPSHQKDTARKDRLDTETR